MPRTFAALLAATGLAVVSTPAHAVFVNWTDWVAQSTNHVDGTVTVDSTIVEVDYDGATFFVQTDSGTNWWTQPNPAALPYTGGDVENAPPPPDIIALGTGGTKTISFSQSVANPFIALVSWNGNVVDFDTPIEIISQGQGFWGNGTIDLNDDGDGFTGIGEVHGIIRLSGTFTSISFTDTSESWHGFTVGFEGLGGGEPVPEPGTIGLIGLGVLGIALGRRRRA
jgi:PEP-CTERM motif